MVFYVSGRGSKRVSALTVVEYQTIVTLLENEFSVPVSERTMEQKSIIRKFYRNRDRYGLEGNPPRLYFGKRLVLK